MEDEMPLVPEMSPEEKQILADLACEHEHVHVRVTIDPAA